MFASRFLLGYSQMQPLWHKPVVILTSSDGTRSAKEIVAAAAQARHKAKLVGTETAGAVLPCRFFAAGRDAVMVAPMSWNWLEGNPIQPDVVVKRDIRYCRGSDVQLKKAKDVLLEMIQERPEQEAQPEVDIAQQPQFLDHNLGDVHATRLVELSVNRGKFAASRSRWADTDNNGSKDLVLPSWSEDVHIVCSDGAKTRILRFPDFQEPIVSIVPAPLDGEVGWFLASSAMTTGTGQQPIAALFSATGDLIWQAHPGLPQGVSGEMITAAGDLNGDGQCELVIGLTTYRQERTGQRRWTRRDEKSYILILDTHAKLQCQRSIDGQISMLEIMEPLKEEDSPAVLVATWHALHRFQFTLCPPTP